MQCAERETGLADPGRCGLVLVEEAKPRGETESKKKEKKTPKLDELRWRLVFILFYFTLMGLESRTRALVRLVYTHPLPFRSRFRASHASASHHVMPRTAVSHFSRSLHPCIHASMHLPPMADSSLQDLRISSSRSSFPSETQCTWHANQATRRPQQGTTTT